MLGASLSVAVAAAPTTIVRPATVDAPAVRLDPPTPVNDAGRDAVRFLNAIRIERGLAPLAWNDAVASAALAHSRDQAARDRMGHGGSDGSDAGDRLERAGFRWRSWGENVAYGQPDAQSVIDAWMASPDHRDNMLADRFTVVAVAVAYSSSGRPYWTMVLAS